MDKKGIAGLLAMIAGLFLWMTVFNPALKQQGPPPNGENPPALSEKEAAASSDKSESEASAGKTDDEKPADKTSEIATVVKADNYQAPEPLLLKHPDFQLRIQPGQGLLDARMHKHFMTAEGSKNKNPKDEVILGDASISSLNLVGDSLKGGRTSVISHDEKGFQASTVFPNGLELIETWSIHPSDSYRFDIRYTLKNTSGKKLSLKNLQFNCGQMSPIQLGDLSFFARQAVGNDQGVDAYDADDNKIHTEFFQSIMSDLEEKAEEEGKKVEDLNFKFDKPEKNFQWIAVKNQYFAFIADIKGGFTSTSVTNRKSHRTNKDGKQDKYTLVGALGGLEDIELAPGASRDLELDIYCGPQEIRNLEKLGHRRKGIMQLNMFMFFKVTWLGWISEKILKVLFFFNNFVGNFGVAIILLTISVKLLFWRITNKSNESMKKMSSLGPKVKELKEKHADNPQLMQQKTMELYRQEGVNPLGGCLPMLLQMPVFIALFNALRSAIELRHTPFLWASDLSQPDLIANILIPIHPLVVIWAVLMLVQQRMTPSSADPTQRKVMMFMPLMMLFFCYGMPSGLTLYWCFQSMMSLLQYRINNKKNTTTQPTPSA